MPAKKKPGGREPQDDVYRVKHISRSAWEDGEANLPGLPVAPQPEAFDDIAADMAMTGEIPLELIREILRRQEAEAEARRAEQSRAAAKFEMIRPEDIVPNEKARRSPKAEFAKETPTRNEIEAAKQQLRAMKAKSRLPEPEEAKEPKEKPAKVSKIKEPKPVKEADDAAGEISRAAWVLNTARQFFAKQEREEEAAQRDEEALYELPLMACLDACYRSTYYFGLRFARPILHFGRHSKPYLLHPVLAIWHLLRAAALSLHHVTIGRAQRAFAHAREERDYGRILRSAINVTMPVAALLVLILVAQSFLVTPTYALRVTFNDNVVGYVANEGVFQRALAAANDHMQPLALAENGDVVIDPMQVDAVEENLQVFAQFEVTRVSPEQLTPSDILTDRLLENSPHEMASGTGIFISEPDGSNSRLVATIRNSTDAESVLQSIITEQTAAQNIDVRGTDTVSFIQSIDLVPGFYPADQMIEAQQLLQMLGGTVEGEQRVALQEGDTLVDVAQRGGISYNELLRLNPWVVGEERRVSPGTEFVVSQEVTLLQVKVIRTETRRAPVPYETIDTNNYNLFQGERRVRVRGVEGEEEITERVTYINGVRYGTPEEISRRVVREPVAQRREIGRRSTRVEVAPGQFVTVNPSAQGFTWPVPGVHRVSSGFGWRNGRMHNGIDIANGRANGMPVVAAQAGVVELVQFGGTGFGHQIVIDHGNGVRTRYAHLMAGSIAVSRGQRVEIGQPIGRVGSTGNSTGPHLHFEVIINGRPQNPLNFVSIPNPRN